MVINGQNFTKEIINRIKETIKGTPDLSRRKLSLLVCEWLNWRSSNNALKDMSCRLALLKLHDCGLIDLPETYKRPPSAFKKKSNPISIKHVTKVECSLSDFGPVEIIQIKNSYVKVSRIWNDLMNHFHYLGAGPLCGAQIRYLIHSQKYGFIGGFAFNSAAWRLEARDQWIGWDERARLKNLNKVVCNSRFLILPYIKVEHLASHVLSLMVKRLTKDWYKKYGIEPILLETFVECGRFKGTCYRAANWKHVGKTKGRGRQDHSNNFSEPIKDIYLYPLRKGVQEVLCDGPPKPAIVVKEPSDWAEEEFGTAELGDERRVKRLMTIARDFYLRPQANVPQACQSRAKTKAVYRFFDDKNNRMEKILEPHYEATLNRINSEKIVLAVQDTTSLNYSTHPATENLGYISRGKEHVIGLMVHDTMSFNIDGTPLGLLDVLCWARDPADFGKRHIRKQLPIEEKESSKWLKAFTRIAQAQKRCPESTLVCIADREADLYDLFHLALNTDGGPKLLIRAEHDRLVAEGQGHLYDYIRSQSLSGTQTVHVPRRGKQPSREARLEVRFAKVTLMPPSRKRYLGELSIWAMLAEEVDCPKNVKPLQWMLLTTFQINSFEEATEKLGWYCFRWNIEIYHKTLKSGCKIEQRQLGQAERIEACLAIDMVIAWRIFHLTKLGREIPDVPCTVFFEDAEWKALVAYKTQNPVPPENPPSLREATRMVASLGGFLGRKSDGHPGTKTLWLGLQRLDDLTEMWITCISMFAPNYLRPPPVSSTPTYG